MEVIHFLWIFALFSSCLGRVRLRPEHSKQILLKYDEHFCISLYNFLPDTFYEVILSYSGAQRSVIHMFLNETNHSGLQDIGKLSFSTDSNGAISDCAGCQLCVLAQFDTKTMGGADAPLFLESIISLNTLMGEVIPFSMMPLIVIFIASIGLVIPFACRCFPNLSDTVEKIKKE
ncbi:hypothetical protein PCE1_001978 [Barthelona sp. PCE]